MQVITDLISSFFVMTGLSELLRWCLVSFSNIHLPGGMLGGVTGPEIRSFAQAAVVGVYYAASDMFNPFRLVRLLHNLLTFVPYRHAWRLCCM